MKIDSISAKYKKPKNKFRRRFFVILGLILLLSAIPSFFTYISLKGTLAHGKALIAAYNGQDFDLLKKEVTSTKGGLERANFSLNFLFWLKIIPILGGYYSDAKGFMGAGVEELIALDKLLNELSPHKEELLFDNHPKKGPDRVTQAVKILDKSLPFLDKVQGNLTKAANNVKNINVNKYPDTFKGKAIRKNLDVAKNLIMGASIAVGDGERH